MRDITRTLIARIRGSNLCGLEFATTNIHHKVTMLIKLLFLSLMSIALSGCANPPPALDFEEVGNRAIDKCIVSIQSTQDRKLDSNVDNAYIQYHSNRITVAFVIGTYPPLEEWPENWPAVKRVDTCHFYDNEELIVFELKFGTDAPLIVKPEYVAPHDSSLEFDLFEARFTRQANAFSFFDAYEIPKNLRQ